MANNQLTPKDFYSGGDPFKDIQDSLDKLIDHVDKLIDKES